MSEEEKKAIGQCKLLLNGDITLHIIDDDGGTACYGTVNKQYNEDLETVLNLIEKQQKELNAEKEKNKELEESRKNGSLSDGFHAYNDLYYQRCMQFQLYVI